MLSLAKENREVVTIEGEVKLSWKESWSCAWWEKSLQTDQSDLVLLLCS